MLQEVAAIAAMGIGLLIFAPVRLDAAAELATQPTSQPSPLVTLNLWPDGAPFAKGNTPADVPTVAVYLPEPAKANGCGIVICPGGGYAHLSIVKEGSDVARWLNENGIAAFVLTYRIKPYEQPVPMLDGQRAIRLVRSRAKEWGVDPCVLG